MPDDPDEPHYSEEQASGGSKENVVRWVLGISLLLVVIAMSAAWIIPALTG
jgi:hypothetical protein